MATVVVASDHAGFKMKQIIVQFLKKEGHAPEDLGPTNEDPVDYPTYAQKVAKRVAKDSSKRGILICGTGVGMAIAANKVKGIRAAPCTSVHLAKMSREHNDSNILCLGAREIDATLAKDIVRAWLATKFSGDERHRRRIQLITELER